MPMDLSKPSALTAELATQLRSRLDFVRLIEQTDRLLAIETALPSTALVAERMRGREGVSESFTFEIDALSTSAFLELKALIGEQISLRVALPTGDWKAWHGYVFDALQLGGDGGLARYRLVLRSWFSFLSLRTDTYLFQDKTAIQILEDIFKEYTQANVRIEVTEPLRIRSLCWQFNETDAHFVERLLHEEGLTYYFEQLDGDAALKADELGQAKHVMVITDRQAARPKLDPEIIRFSRGDVRGTALLMGQKGTAVDTVHRFDAHREVQTSAVTLGAYNYKHVVGTTASVESSLDQGPAPQLEDYDGHGAYRYENSAHANRAAELRLQAHELKNKRFDGASGCRHMMAGASFSLIDHPHYGANATALLHAGQMDYKGALTASHQRPDNQFTVLWVEHEAANNLGSEAAKLLDQPELDAGSYSNTFGAVPAAAPIVLPFQRKPTGPSITTALVVGLQNEAITTDRDHRVKVQFHWQRGQTPNAGGLIDTGNSVDTQGNAPNNETAGTWVRVAESLAGPNWGAQFTPRIGTEVLVTFLDGDIDRPLIVAQVHNGQDAPPFSAGIDSGANHAGTISGLDVPTLNRDGKSQLLFDDAPGQVRTQLRTQSPNSPHTSLTLGYIIQQAFSGAQRGSYRGSGFEATTDGWMTWRANAGMLISTTARTNGQSTQLDVQETTALLKGANDLGKRLNDAASGAKAHTLKSHTDKQSVPELIKAIDAKQDGTYTAPVNGQDHTKPTADKREGGDPVERFAKPIVLMETPSSAALATPGLIATFAGQDQSLISQTDTQLTAAHTASLASGETTSLFTHEGGVQAIAANGPVSLKAHTDQLEILADKSVSVVSVNDVITVQANQKILLQAGDSSITLEGGNVTFKTSGSFTVKGSSHVWASGGGNAASLASLPDSRLKLFDQAFVLKDAETQKPLANTDYRIRRADGTYEYGQTDADGKTHIVAGPQSEGVNIEYVKAPAPIAATTVKRNGADSV